MKSTIISVAVFGFAASASGAFQLCQYTANTCTGAGTNCVDLDLADGCHVLTAIFTGVAEPRYRATQGDDKKKLTLNVFNSNTCDVAKSVIKPVETAEKSCFKPERPTGSTDAAFDFYLKWETKAAVASSTAVKPTTTKKGAGSSVVPSIIASVATVMLGLLF